MTKLSLHKETLRTLNVQESLDLAGGVPLTTLPFSKIPGCGVSCVAPCGTTPLTKVGCEPSGIVSCFPSAYRTNCAEPM